MRSIFLAQHVDICPFSISSAVWPPSGSGSAGRMRRERHRFRGRRQGHHPVRAHRAVGIPRERAGHPVVGSFFRGDFLPRQTLDRFGRAILAGRGIQRGCLSRCVSDQRNEILLCCFGVEFFGRERQFRGSQRHACSSGERSDCASQSDGRRWGRANLAVLVDEHRRSRLQRQTLHRVRWAVLASGRAFDKFLYRHRPDRRHHLLLCCFCRKFFRAKREFRTSERHSCHASSSAGYPSKPHGDGGQCAGFTLLVREHRRYEL